jgi:pyruvate formate lyase activating enzyme
VDIAREAHARGVKTVFVTAGYISPAAREEVFEHMDATNVDLKAFTEDFYGKVTLSHLKPVLDTLEWLATKTHVWTEVTNLMIPGLNDDPAESADLAAWIRDHMGTEVPLHFTAFHPDYKMTDRPRTPPSTLLRAREIALARGLRHVYVGNVHDQEGQTTYCPGCGEKLIERDWHAITAYRMTGNKCAKCGRAVAGVFLEDPVRRSDGGRRYLGLV